MGTLRALFKVLDEVWGKVCCDPVTSPFARLVDSYSSPCTYCHNARSMMIGAAVAVLPSHWWLSLALIGAVYVLRLGERAVYGP